MTDFQLQLLNPYYRNRKLPVALLHFTAGFLLLDAWYESLLEGWSRGLALVFLLLALLEVLYAIFARRLQQKRGGTGRILRLVTGAAFLGYAGLQFTQHRGLSAAFMVLAAAAFVLIFFIEKRWNRPFIVRVNEEGVLFPRVFRSEWFPWNGFNHVILRGNLLTLDFRDNRIVQLEVEGDSPMLLSGEDAEDRFNAFCRQHTEAGVPEGAGSKPFNDNP
jgi:hypothetical protein